MKIGSPNTRKTAADISTVPHIEMFMASESVPDYMTFPDFWICTAVIFGGCH